MTATDSFPLRPQFLETMATNSAATSKKHFLCLPTIFFPVNVAASCFVPIFLLRPFDYR